VFRAAQKIEKLFKTNAIRCYLVSRALSIIIPFTNSNTSDKRHTLAAAITYVRTDYVGEKWRRGEGRVSDTRSSFLESQASVESVQHESSLVAFAAFLLSLAYLVFFFSFFPSFLSCPLSFAYNFYDRFPPSPPSPPVVPVSPIIIVDEGG